MLREFSEDRPELMDLPHHDEAVLRSDLENLGLINRHFGGRRAVEKMFHFLAGGRQSVTLIDLASGYGDQGRNIVNQAAARKQNVTVVAVDRVFQTLQIARGATSPGQRLLFVQADVRHLPFRDQGADLVFCSLALHHFAEADAVKVLSEMSRVGRLGASCVDLVRCRLATWAIWLMTTFLLRDPMTRHDARLSVRRAFTRDEMKSLAKRAGWRQVTQRRFLLFQQGVSTQLSA